MAEAWICDAVRTPIGRYGGALAAVRPDDMAADMLRALTARNPGFDPAEVGQVIFGCTNQAGEDSRDVARMAVLLAGMPETVPAITVNRLCASGLDAVAMAANAINAGEIDLAIAGGVESMTRAPFAMGKQGRPWARESLMEDTTIGWRFVNPAMKEAYGVEAMPETAENVADDWKIAREDQDAFALRSQQRMAAAIANGYHADEIVPVEITGRKPVTVSADEHPRPETTLDDLTRLKPFVRRDGTITAGNASGVNDGAAALIVATEDAAKRNGLVPRARILGAASAGVAPRVMGIGPVASTRRLNERLGLAMDDYDLIELNEAFAAQALAVLRDLGVADDAEHVNPHGGAIAMGHPLGMSGTRLAMTAVHGLEVRGGKRALATMCVGVGQGVSLALERA
ncbi:MAG: 3-oxoadipyl-CoA thiolase [Sphingomonadaceae bacterium]|nr:3-oxoadipyl-CoA thiolase [Sphingomonadaceae bacterium]MCP5390869.1 3-oxoadipyl-CoA thiolase [Sphingomonadaceae bacterium]MCP5394625.1 3-oxoadipyl-CoA thiolase [Sphingomonadaceae bacterium]